MTRRTAPTVATLLCLLLLPGLAAAQIQQTPNTLTLSASAPRPRATIAELTLLVGHWKGGFLGSTAEEIWLPAAGGSMFGAARLYKDTEVVFYEIMIAVEEEGSVSLKLTKQSQLEVGEELPLDRCRQLISTRRRGFCRQTRRPRHKARASGEQAEGRWRLQL